MNGIRKALLLWGAICLVGFGTFEFWHAAISQMNFTLLLLTVVGFAGTLNFFPKAFSKRPVVVLGALFVIGLIVSWLWEGAVVGIPPVSAPFAALWLFLFAVGFAWTGHHSKETMWYSAAAIQLVVLAGLLLNSGEIVAHAFGLLAIATGVPLLLMGYKH
jgi:hypothetical protein